MVTQRLKRWESPRKRGRNSKGRGGSARRRQQKKQLQMLRKRLKQQNTDEIGKRRKKRKEELNVLLLFVLGDYYVGVQSWQNRKDFCCGFLTAKPPSSIIWPPTCHRILYPQPQKIGLEDCPDG